MKWCIVFIAFGDVVCKAAAVATGFNELFPVWLDTPPPAAEWDWEWVNNPWWSPWTADELDGETPTEWGGFWSLPVDATVFKRKKSYMMLNMKSIANFIH